MELPNGVSLKIPHWDPVLGCFFVSMISMWYEVEFFFVLMISMSSGIKFFFVLMISMWYGVEISFELIWSFAQYPHFLPTFISIGRYALRVLNLK